MTETEVNNGLFAGTEQFLQMLRTAEVSTPETTWRKTAIEDYKFYAGKQDSPEILAELAAKNRPATTYNEVMPKINMLVGLAAQTKHDILLNPVGVEDEPLAEIATGAMKHFRKKMNLSRKELECFEHTVKSGRSLLYFYIDNSNPFEPEIKCTRWPGWAFFIDPQSKEYDLSDARYVILDKWLNKQEIHSRWPGLEITRISQYSHYVPAQSSQYMDMPVFFNEARDLYRLCEIWYYKIEEVMYFINPVTQGVDFLPLKEFGKFVSLISQGLPGPNGQMRMVRPEELQATKSFKKIWYYVIFSGVEKIEEGKSPFRVDGFPGVLFGAYKNEDDNAWFSVITMMKDPQKALNTMRRQLSHLLQTLPKGILAHESNAILNIEEYEERSSDPSFHLEVAPGAIDKFKFVQQPSISPLYQSVDQSMSQSMRDVSGIQNELMGKQETGREAVGSVERRTETGLAVLYTLYDNYRESRWRAAKIQFKLMQQYVTTPQLIRIEGAAGQQLIQINTQINPDSPNFNDITAGDFDLEISETSEMATARKAVASMLVEHSQNNPGAIPSDVILDYADVPYSVKERVKQYNEQNAAAAQQEKDRLYELELLKIQMKGNEVAADQVIKQREVEIKARQQAAKPKASSTGS
jgi:hypothetical protein